MIEWEKRGKPFFWDYPGQSFMQAYIDRNYLYFRFGRKKSVIIPMLIAFVASSVSVAIPTNKSLGKHACNI